MTAKRPSPPARGFTLIELMITLVIAAILFAIAIPSYRRYVLRTQRTDATTALLRVQAAQEKYFLQNNGYAIEPSGLGLEQTSDGKLYKIELQPGAVQPSGTGVPVTMDYTAQAIPLPGTGQTEDTRCAVFEIDHNGVRHAKDQGGADSTSECWR